MSKKSRDFAIGATIAAGVGYLVGILTAPKSGRQTRKDISKSAAKAKTEGEKQLKKLHSEINVLLDKANKQLETTKGKANKELAQAIKKADKAKQKARLLLSALHEGDADDPNLKAVISEISLAKKNLVKFIKK